MRCLRRRAAHLGWAISGIPRSAFDKDVMSAWRWRWRATVARLACNCSPSIGRLRLSMYPSAKSRHRVLASRRWSMVMIHGQWVASHHQVAAKEPGKPDKFRSWVNHVSDVDVYVEPESRY